MSSDGDIFTCFTVYWKCITENNQRPQLLCGSNALEIVMKRKSVVSGSISGEKAEV